MRILFCGGRNYGETVHERNTAYAIMASMASLDNVVIHGDASGADELINSIAGDHRMRVKAFPADWEKHGRAAGPIRNKQMLEEGQPNLVVAFPGGRGTEDMVSQALKAGIPVMRVTVGDPLGSMRQVEPEVK